MKDCKKSQKLEHAALLSNVCLFFFFLLCVFGNPAWKRSWLQEEDFALGGQTR